MAFAPVLLHEIEAKIIVMAGAMMKHLITTVFNAGQ